MLYTGSTKIHANMTIIYSDLFTKHCEKWFGIKRDDAQKTMLEPDFQQKLVSQGLQMRLYLKLFGKQYLLVISHYDGANTNVQLAFKLKSEWIEQIADKNDILKIVQSFAMQYGLPLKIGQQSGKFIYNELIPIRRADLTNIMFFHNPSKHKFIANTMIRVVNPAGQYYAQCAIAFCIDVDEYLKALE